MRATFKRPCFNDRMNITNLQIRRVDYQLPRDRTSLTRLLNGYAQDPMGGGEALQPAVLQTLCDALAVRPYTFSFIAWNGDEALGLVNCFESFSTFKAQPLVNIHDLVVRADARGRGVGQALLQAVQVEATKRGACKITLEVLTGNTVAIKSYERFGFASYQLDPAAGHAVLMQKWLAVQ